MLGVFVRYMKDKKNTVIGYIVVAIATLEMYVSLFPFIQKQSEQLNEVMKAYPESFMKAFGVESTAIIFSRIEGYLSTEQFSFIWPILVIILAGSLANSIALNEIDRGTIELTLAQPISRVKLFFSRYLGGVLALLAFVFISNYSLLILVKLHDTTVGAKNLFVVTTGGFMLALAIFSMATLFSVLFSEKGKSTFLMGIILIAMYAINVVSTLKENLKDLQYFSFFHYFNPTTLFVKAEYVKYSFPVFIGATIVFTALAVFWFNRRDIAV